MAITKNLELKQRTTIEKGHQELPQTSHQRETKHVDIHIKPTRRFYSRVAASVCAHVCQLHPRIQRTTRHERSEKFSSRQPGRECSCLLCISRDGGSDKLISRCPGKTDQELPELQPTDTAKDSGTSQR